MASTLSQLSVLAVWGSQVTAGEPDPWTLLAVVETRWTAPVSFKDDDTDHRQTIETFEQMGEVRFIYRPHLGVRVGIGLGVEHGNYLNDDSHLGVRAGWLRVPAALMMSQHWGLSTLTSFGSATANDVPVTHDHRWMIQAGPVWVRDQFHLIGVFVNYATRLGKAPRIFLFPSVEWLIAPALNLTVVDELDGISRLTWQVVPQYAIGLRADVRLREYRLAENNEGALNDDQVAFGIETTWCPTGERMRLTMFAGASLMRRLTYLVDGDTVLSKTAGPAFQGGFQVHSEF